MKFGPVNVREAAGAILAHSLKLGQTRLRKGIVLTRAHVTALQAQGTTHVTVARLDPGDIHENTAAARLAAALVPDPDGAGLRLGAPVAGRVNILAAGPGVAMLDVAALARFNKVHPMITIATVPPFQQMAAGGMVATIKIIAYAVPGKDLALAGAAAPAALRLAGPVFQSAGLIVTEIPGGPTSDKGLRAITGRIEALGLTLADTCVVAHETKALAGALAEVQGDMVLILTGSATSDPQDVAPEALRRAGGQVTRFGMPVDPGNLLFLGVMRTPGRALGPTPGRALGGGATARPVIGLPGCARSPALNGADWVLSRVACGVAVSGDDIAAMGVGGLLKEIPTRPQPRAARRAR